MEKENLKEFQKLARMFSRDRIVTPEEIDLVLAGILQILSTFKSDNEALNKDTKKEVEDILKTISIKQKELYQDIVDGKKEMSAEYKEQCDELKYLIEEFKKIKPEDGLDGISPDVDDIIVEVLRQIKLPENKTEIIELTGEDMIKQINDLDFSPENLIDAKRIKGLEFLGKKSTKGWIPTVLSNAMDLNTSARADGYAIVWDDTLKMHKYSASGGGGGSGTVNSGTQYRLAYYAATGTAVSENAAITGSRVLVSNANGLPTHSTTTTTTLGYLDATSSIQTQLDAKIPLTYLDTDITLAANSDVKIATQKAVKAYVDASVTGLLDLKGSTDCSANPNYPSALKGDSYYVTVAGKIGGASGKSVDIGDVYVALSDNAGGTEASVGTSWFVMEHNLSGVALTSGTLAQFAATTSLQLLGVISDETGSGALVFGTSPTIATPVLNGIPTGTGVAIPSTVSTLVLRDTNGNVTNINNLEGYTTTATAAGTTTLTVSSNNMQYFTGSTTQTVTMPVASTLALGQSWWIVNLSTGAVTVNSSGANAIVIVAAGCSAEISCILTSGTTAASWNAMYIADIVATGKKLTVSNTLTLVGTDATTITFQGTDTYVGRATTDTLSNKTLTAPRIASAGFLADANGNEQIIFTTTTSAVNEFTFVNAATGNAPQITASGGDTNVDIKLVPKGTGIVKGSYHRFMVRLADSTTVLTTGTSKGGDFRISKYAITVKAVGAYVDTAATGGTLLTIDVNEAGTTIISTKITLDASEKTSETAATVPVISDASIAADAIVTFDIDAIGNTTAGTGLVVWVDYVIA